MTVAASPANRAGRDDNDSATTRMRCVSRVPTDDAALRLAVDFCNTHDLLADPTDKLSVEVAGRLAERHGLPQLTDGLHASDLPALRDVRQRLYQVFAADSVDAKATAVNHLLRAQSSVARLLPTPDGGLRLAAVGGGDPVGRYAIVLADAIARVLAEGGADRVRTCLADPCRCVYVDRTRAGRQRYCCELCNDRMASAAYRRRRA
jgi:predicted RNA-binding Zn ribbon-like protein